MLIDSERLMTRATLWFLRYRNLKDDIAKTVEHFAPGVKAIAASLDKFLSPEESVGLRQAAERLIPKQCSERSGHAIGKLRSALFGARYRRDRD